MADTEVIPGMGTIDSGGIVVEEGPATIEPITAGSSQSIGTVESSSGSVTVRHADGSTEQLEAGSPIFQGDQLETSADGSVGVVLADGTSFSMAEGGKMVMDEMVYDPATQEGSIGIQAVEGVFTFVSGQIAKTDPDAMTLETPVATIGIRGTQVGIEVGEGGQSNVVLMEEADGFVGEVTVSNDSGLQILNNAFQGTSINSADSAPSETFTVDQGQMLSTFGDALGSLPATEGNNANTYNQAPPDEGAAVEEADTEVTAEEAVEDQEALEEQLAEEQEADEEQVAQEDLGEEQLAEEQLAEETLSEEALTEEALAEESTAEEVAGEEALAEEDTGDLENFETAAGGDQEALADEISSTEEQDATDALSDFDGAGQGGDQEETDGIENFETASGGEDDAEDGGEFISVASDIPAATIIPEPDVLNTTPTPDPEPEPEPEPTPDPDPDPTPDPTPDPASAPVITRRPESLEMSEDGTQSIDLAVQATGNDPVSSVQLSGLPEGSTLILGTEENAETIVVGTDAVSLSPDQLEGLQFQPPADYNTDDLEGGAFELTVSATSEGGATSTEQTVGVTVDAVDDLAAVVGESDSGEAGTPIALNLSASMEDENTTEEVTAVTVSNIPEGAILTDGAGNELTVTEDGSVTLSVEEYDDLESFETAVGGVTITPPESSAGEEINLQLSVTDSDGGTSEPTSTTVSVSEPTFVPTSPSVSDTELSLNEDGTATLDIGIVAGSSDPRDAVTGATISDIPVGATLALEDGTEFTATEGSTSIELSAAQVAEGIDVTPPEDSGVDFDLTVTATSADGSDSGTAAVEVIAVADAPTVEGAGSGVEDAAIPVTIAAADTDADGSEAITSIEIGDVPVGATLTFADGTTFTAEEGSTTISVEPGQVEGLTLTPPADFNGEIDLAVVATATDTDPDTGAETTSSTPTTVTVDVAAVDDTGVVDGGGAGDEDTAIELNLTAAMEGATTEEITSVTVSDIPDGAVLQDAQGNELTVTDGAITLTPDQLEGITITPPADSSEDFDLALSATDSDGGAVATGTANVAIAAVDDTGVVDGGGAGDEDTAIELNLTASMEGETTEDITSVTVSAIPEGAVLKDSDGNELTVTDGAITLTPDQLDGVTFTPPADASGTFNLDLSATDSDGGVNALGTAEVVVAAVDDTGVVDGGGAGDEDTAIELNLTASMEGETTEDITSVTVSAIPEGAVLKDSDGNELTVTDGAITLTPDQLDGVTFTPPADASGTFNLDLSATDSDGGVNALGTAEVVVAAVDDTGVVDGGGAGDEDTAIELNLTASMEGETTEDITSVTVSAIPEGAVLKDAQGNELTVTDGVITLTPDQLDGVTFTPPADASGTFNLDLSATDSDGGVNALGTAEVVVAAVDDTGVVDGGGAGDEDTAIELNLTASMEGETTEDITSVTVSAIPEGAVLKDAQGNELTVTDGAITLTPDQLDGVTFTPPADASGTFNLDLSATDSDGGVNALGTAEVVVAAVDDTGVVDGGGAGDEDTAIELNLTASMEGETTEDITSVTVSAIPEGAVLKDSDGNELTVIDGAITLTPDQLEGVTFTPPADASGTFNLDLSATDSDGGVNALGTAEVVVAAVDDTGVVDGGGAGDEDTAIELNLTASMEGETTEDITSVTVSAIPEGAVLKDSDGNELTVTDGAITLTPDQLDGVTFTPPADASGTFNLDLSATDSDGGVNALGTAEVVVAAVDDTGVVDGGGAGDEDTAIELNLTASMEGETTEDITSVTVSAIPEGAVLKDSDGNELTVTDGAITLTPDQLDGVTFTPPADASGTFNLDLSATDSDGGVNALGTAEVVVAAVDDTGVVDGGGAGDEDTAIELNLTAVMEGETTEEITSVTVSNIPDGAVLQDAQGNELTVTDGAITFTPDQLEGITITPPADSSEDFDLALSATDSDGGAVATGTANVEIAAVDDTGVVDGCGAGLEDTAIELNLTASMEGTTTEEITSVTVSDIPDGAVMHDAQGNELTVTDGSITLNPDQLEGITITPPENSSEDFDLALSATDSDGGATAIGTATIEITDVGDAPEISGGGEGDEDTSIALNLAVSIPDATESVESITITNIPEGAILSAGTVNEDGSVTLTPEQLDGLTITPTDDSGADFNLSVTATSGDGVSSTESIEVVVDAVADAPTVSLSVGEPIAVENDDKPGHGFGDTNHGHDGPRPGVGNQGEGGGEGEAGTGGDDGSIFPLDLSASLNDTDGSESLSVTLAGVPEGAELSAGTDNGDGSWTLSPDDLDGLNLFVPEGISDEFTLTATATATDTDPDTGEVTTASSSDEAEVGLDTVAEAPELTVTAAAGDEDTAIPLDVNAALTDTDGSEVLSVTIAGVPDGAELSAGTDNGDGSWTLGADDLEGLTVTPPDDSNEDFDLSITATSTELHGGDTATTTATLSVDVSGVADAPTLTATIGDATVEPGSEPVEVEIGPDNVTSSDGGFTVVARSLDPNGNLVDGDISFNANPPGFGVAGDASGADSELGFDSSTDTSEQLVVSLDGDVTSADVSFAWMHPGEQATYELYQDGVKVGEGTVTGITDNVDPAITMTADGGVAFDEIVFSAPDSGDDYLINSISFETNDGGDGTIEYPLNIDSSLTDTDGSETLSVTVSNLPEGAVLSAGTVNDDGSVTLNPNDLEGLTLTVPGDTEDGFDLAISATSSEDDGDSATVNTSVGVVIPDGDAEAPELSVENAAGLEDTAINLDIGAALTDTDGSETLSVTIAGVPDGAELSAGTDNGDGSWTLTADDLEGLSVTPSDDSNEDFQLEITATSTEISTGDTATETATLDVDVTGVADAPELNVTLGDGTVTNGDGTGGGDGSGGSNVEGADIDGTSGEDMLFGTQGDDTISGEGDEDVLYGGDGNDILEGGGHDDRLFGGDGDDTLDGGSSDDFLVGGAGNDVAIGGSGEDVYVFRPGDGQDVFEGGSGDDTIVLLNDEGALADRSEWTLNLTSGSYEEDDDKIEFSGGAEGTIEFADGSTLSFNGVQSIDWSGDVDLGGDEAHFADEAGATITTGGEEDSIMGTDSDDIINSGSDEDVVDAGAGDDIIDGGRDEDFLIGGEGNDEIDGGSHNDFIVGGEGDDEIVGGSGTDTAAFDGPREEYMVTENDDGTFTVTDLVDGRDGTDTVSGVEKFQFGNETVNKNDLLDTNPEVPEGEPQVEFPLDVSAMLTDEDGSETLSVTVSGLPEGATLSSGTDNGDGSFTLTPDQLSGLTLNVPTEGGEDFTMTVSATSAEDDGDTSTVSVDVAVPMPDGGASVPTLTVSDAAGDEDTAIDLDVNAALTDTDGSESLSITIAGVPEGAELSAGTDNGDGSWTLNGDQVEGLTITPAEDSNEDFSLTVTATSTETSDGDTASTTSTIDVDVTGVADTPQVTINNETGNEDQWIQLNLDSAVSDTDGSETLSISISNVPEGAVLNPGSINDDGTWSVSADELPSVCILPPADFNGQMNMTLNVTATENDGDTATASETFVVTVDPTADVPVVIGSGSGAEDTAIDLELLASVSGVETVESVTINGVPEGAILSAGSPNEDGSITLTPDELVGLTITPPADFNGSLEISVSAVSTDGSESADVPVSISVSAVPDVPVVSLSAASGDEDSAISLDITANVPDSTETVESVTISGVPAGASLSAGTDNGDGSWTLSPGDLSGLTLTPTQDLNGSFDLTVSATSTDGGQSDGASLNVDVEPVPESTNLKFTVSNESIDENSETLDLSNITPDDFGTTETVEFEGGEVDVTYVDEDTAFAEFTDAWGDVSDIDADSDVAADVSVANFADVDVDLGDGGDSTVTIDGAAQGDISTGDGDDVIDVDALSIGDDWSNLFEIDTGDGSDQVTVTGDQGVTEFDIDTGEGSDIINLDGNYTESVVDAGAGDDVIVGGSGDDVILAGDGDDLMSGGSGSDVLDGGEGTDTLQLSNNYDDYSISFDGDQMIVSGPEGVDTVTGVEMLEFADGTLAVEDIGLEPVVSLSTFGGDEDTAIAIEIGVDVVNPFEEVATVSISGVPEGADLSAGTDNGGGNWTLTAGDLDGLTVTPPQDFFGQLDLSVSATSTEGVSSANAPLAVDVAPVNDAPVLEGDGTLEVEAGGTTTITSEDFNVTDVDNDPSEITYTVTDEPDNGTLFLDGEALDEDDIFTQEDIDNGLLQYTADEAGFSWAEGTPSWDEGGAPVDQSNLTVPETAEGVTVVFEGENADNHNTVGWYKLDENGDPMEPQVLFVDASEDGNTLEKGTEITLEGLEPGEQFGFFIIQDGANKYPDLAEAVEAGLPLDFDENGNITFENSALEGTEDNDVLTGGLGSDVIDGGDGDDTIIGGSDEDYLYGGKGDDVLSGGSGDDIIDGGRDDDTLILSGNLEDYIITRAGGTFTIEDTRENGDGTDRVNNVEEFEFADGTTLSKDELKDEATNLGQKGNNSDNEMIGTDGDDKLKGEKGDDELFGGDGFDQLDGGKDDDILEGGAGDDIIKGGSGDDIAVFSGDLSDYTITQDGDSFFVSDNREDGDGTDEVKEVESFQFNDQTVSKDDMEDIAEEVSDDEPSSVTIEASDIFFTGESLNPDGVNHAVSGTNEEGNLMIGFEDLTGGGDNDFNDVTISVKYEGVDDGSNDSFGLKASDGEDELQENDGTDGGYSVTDGEAAVSVVIDPSGMG